MRAHNANPVLYNYQVFVVPEVAGSTLYGRPFCPATLYALKHTRAAFSAAITSSPTGPYTLISLIIPE